MYRTMIALVATLAASTAVANQVQFGDWVFEPAGTNTEYASTENGSNDGLAKTCPHNDNLCYWTLVTKIKCSKGSAIPVILSADTGSMSATLRCITEQDPATGLAMEAFDNPADVQSFLEKAGNLSIAVPLADGTFTVMRFSMDGAKQALAALDDFESRKPQPSARNAKDETL